MSEANLMRRIQLALVKCGARVFRNAIGFCTCRGTPITYGLGTGTSDLIGLYTITVSPALVGKKLAVFVAVEVKDPKRGRVTDEQTAFLKMVRDAGGIGVIATSEDQAVAFLSPS